MENSRIAAGGLNNPVVYDRFATGVNVSQMITDFGRTSNLVESARLRAKEQNSTLNATRAQVLVQVDRTYYAVRRAQSVLEVAQKTVAARQLVADQVKALAESKLKSSVDVSFANVNLSEAKLLLVSAQNQLKASLADLSTSLGYSSEQQFELVDEELPGQLPSTSNELIKAAEDARPEIAALRLEESAAQRYAKAERALSYPTVSTLFTAGYIPGGQSPLSDRWVAAGINLNIPVFNGKLYSARYKEAQYRTEAAAQKLKDLENQVARDVRVAYLNAVTAYDRIDLTRQLLDQARLANDLAKSRYELGLGSIVELSQAQLNQTSAEIAGVSARYEYQLQRSILDFQVGAK